MKLRHALAFVPLLAGCRADPPEAAASVAPAAPPAAPAPGAAPASGLVLAEMDRAADPARDFYRFANGGWLDAHPVPADESLWGVFSEVRQRNELVLQKVLEEAAQQPTDETNKKLGDFFASGMDEEHIEAGGLEPLAEALAAIDGLNTTQELPSLLARLHALGVSALFRLRSGADLTDATMSIAFVGQDGLGLPERDYYLRDTAESVELREQYTQHVATMLTLLDAPVGPQPGKSPLEAGLGKWKVPVRNVLALEKALAQASYGAVELRDPQKRLNKIAVADAQALTPHFDWSEYFREVGLDGLTTVNLANPAYFQALDALIAEEAIEPWKDYLRWHLVREYADYLPATLEAANFDFFGRTLGGAKEAKPRWKRVLDATGGDMGEVLSQAFVRRAFSPTAKARCQRMVDDLIASFRGRILKLDWMGDETRAKALAKLDAIKSKIGYPDKWRDWSGLAISRDSYAANHARARAFNRAYDLAKIGKPVDKTEFRMPAYIVNASYSATNNDITFPAGILQPPFFSETYDDALNYGAMGGVIGHELTHGFDDGGSQYDAAGNLANWWTPQDREEFERRIKVVEDQFSAYVAIDDLKVNGKLTLGENLADLGGLCIAYDALQRAQQGRPAEKLDGFTPEQRFFIAWARQWRCNYTPARLKLQVNTNPHSPANFRAVGPLSNLDTFQQAFGLEDGAPVLRPKTERARVW